MSDSASSRLTTPTRRDFLKGSTAALVGGALVGTLPFARSAHAAGSDMIKIGLVGCGGRGSGAAKDALDADPGVKLTAMADLFPDRLRLSLSSLAKEYAEKPEKIDVPESQQFIGFDAYEKLLATDVNMVILATPPCFRPMQYRAAIMAGKHCFVEKPVAVDAPGVRSVLETNKLADEKGLNVVSGLCYRYDLAKRELIQRIHDGAIGDIVALHVSYNGGQTKYAERQEQWSDMEYQLRDWNFFTWGSGDFIVEQHVHSLDKGAWAMGDASPVKVSALGGRQARKHGNVYDHFACVYEFPSGAKMFSNCCQIDGASQYVNDVIIGTKGTAQMMPPIHITGVNAWKYPKRWSLGPAFDLEHKELIDAIRSGSRINNGAYMANSTMIAIMGRMSAYTGKTLTWDECLNSKENLMPEKMEFGPAPPEQVAVPGLTEFS